MGSPGTSLHRQEHDQRNPDEHRDHGEEAREHVTENAHRARSWRLFRSLSEAPVTRRALLDDNARKARYVYLSSQTSLSHQGPVTEFAKPFTWLAYALTKGLKLRGTL